MPKANLRIRIISPLIVVAAIASILVAISSWKFGKERIEGELSRRFTTIKQTVNRANFPLTDSVLSTLAELTDTEWLTLDIDGNLRSSTITLSPEQWKPEQWKLASSTILPQTGLTRNPANQTFEDNPPRLVSDLANRRWLVRTFFRETDSLNNGNATVVAILFDHEKIRSASERAALLPLLTGLSTIASITLVILFITSRLINRIQRLQSQVEIISSGNFQSRLSDEADDEIGGLARSVNQMASQLNQLWKQIHQQQRSKLLHQVASGIAHQLRNTLTGAKIAMEIHAKSCDRANDEEVSVALHQLEIAESYVKRLTLVGSGPQQPAESRKVIACLNDLKSTHRSVAEHLQVDLSWRTENIGDNLVVLNGSLFVDAISNLILNAIQASQRVVVSSQSIDQNQLEIEVIDYGEGIPEAIQDEVFEPFSTTKPEGMGLGLALVKQAAEQLKGNVTYKRYGDYTVFRFQCRCEYA